MDPVSITVSLIALFNASKKISILLFKIGGVRKEVKHYSKLLGELADAFKSLSELPSEDSIRQHLSNNFLDQLAECASDLETAQGKLQDALSRLDRNPVTRVLGTLRWCLSSETWLKKFFEKIETYHKVFVWELLCTNTKALSSITSILFAQACYTTNPNGSRTAPCVCLRTEASREFLAETTTISRLSGPQGPSLAMHRDIEAFDTNNAAIVNATDNRPLLAPTSPYKFGVTRIYNLQGPSYSVVLRAGSLYRRVWLAFDEASEQSEDVLSGSFVSLQVRWLPFLTRYLGFRLSVFLETGSLPSVGISLDSPRQVPWEALVMDFARSGDVKSMERLFSLGKASVWDISRHSTTLLHIAAGRNDLRMIKYLLSRGAKANAMDADGDTPLHLVIAHKEGYEAVRVLLEKGGEISTPNHAGKTPLHNWANDTTRRVFLTYDGPLDLEEQDAKGMTLVHYLSYSKTTSKDDLSRLLCDRFSCLTMTDGYGRTPLHFSVMRGNVALSSYIIDRLNARGRQRQAPNTNSRSSSSSSSTILSSTSLLVATTQSKRTEIIDLILNQHGPGNTPLIKDRLDHQGWSVFHHAAWRNNPEAIEKFVDRDASAAEMLVQRDKSGETPLDIAKRVGAAQALAYMESLIDGDDGMKGDRVVFAADILPLNDESDGKGVEEPDSPSPVGLSEKSSFLYELTTSAILIVMPVLFSYYWLYRLGVLALVLRSCIS